MIPLSLVSADACREVGFKWNEDFIMSINQILPETQNVIYFKTIGLSDKNGFPYVVFYSPNSLLKIPRSYVVTDGGDKIEILSDLCEVYEELPFLEEGRDFNVTLSNMRLNEDKRNSVLKKGNFLIEWDNDKYNIDVSRLNFILISDK